MGKRKNNAKTVKQTVKYLSVTPDISIVKSILQRVTDGVISAISNAPLNARSGEVHVPPHLKSVIRRHNHQFDYLNNKKKPLKHKRCLLIQQCGALPIIVSLIATLLGSIGSEFISRIFRKNE